MAILEIETKGNYGKLSSWLERLKHITGSSILDKYGKIGVDLLKANTPIKTGKTSNSWYYKVEMNSKASELYFCNDNINDGVNVAIIIYRGHSNNGYYIRGVDYITPALQPIFNDIAKSIEWEVRNV